MRRGLVWSLVFIIGAAVVSLAATVALGHAPLLGLDLKGGVSVVLRPEGKVTSATLQQSVSIIDRRVNGLGVANSNVTSQGQDIVISLPGIKNAQAALAVLGQTATAYFRPVLCQIPPYAGASTSTPSTTTPAPTKANPSSPTTAPATPATTAKALGGSGGSGGDVRLASVVLPADPGQTSPTTAPPPATTIVPSQSSGGTPVAVNSPPADACNAPNAAQFPTTPVEKDTQNATVILPYYQNASSSSRYVLGKADMTGNGVHTASVVVSQTGQYQVQLSFTGKGATEFDKIAAARYPFYKQNPSNPPYQSLEAFELDGTVYSAPTIQAQSFNGTAVISGSTASPFTYKQANDLSVALKYGSLPARFVPQSVQTVSATIGKDSLKAGLLAGAGGIIVVLLYMIAYYRLLGLVVLLGLGVGGSLLYSIITELSQSSGLTLTLAGVTGIIVSVGITVDSYVVYFERLKDEVRAGRSVRQSVERSFNRAFRTVLTADFVAFLAALILYLLTVGDVRGFAFMLGLSTLLDVVTAYLFIRPMTILVGRRRAFTEAKYLGVARGLGARPLGDV
ncbi:MAG TPA: protein translocase subunit SecD [Acidimicrobiales bacterium]|nr:protein translocase subunit SecD [Acidimicrobiales bacterium]